jgi:hypothetical protein
MLLPTYLYYYHFAADATPAPPLEPPRIHSGAAVGFQVGGFNERQRLEQNKQDVAIAAAVKSMIR